MRTILLLIILAFAAKTTLLAADSDTTTVRTIEFNTKRAGWYDFPNNPDTKYRKIIMNFKVKCPDGKACGEWDYVSNVYVEHYFAPNYRFDGKSLASASFMLDTSWDFTPVQEGDAWVLSKTPKAAKQIYFYNDELLPTKATDSMTVWNTYFTYTIDEDGVKTDSTLVAADSTVTLSKKRVYFKDAVTIFERIEIMRYITPYGNGLNLGDGWLYEIDITDFLPLLSGPVYIYSPCGGWGDQTLNDTQEALQLSFDFIEGTPTRDVIRLEKMWQNNHASYNGNFENLFPAKEITLAENEKGARLKVIQTGHGFGGNDDNCAEFCKKEANVKINDVQRYARYIWRECGSMPLYPQGGTWVNDRTNWCPGMDVEHHDYELTPYIGDGATHTVDYSMEYYDTPWEPGSNRDPYWIISSYLITYSEPNFNLDADLLDIINPTQKQKYKRQNPSCFNYAVLVKNNGKENITKIDFKFGFEGDDNQAVYSWTGNLAFLDTTTVIFDNFFRNDEFKTTRKFNVEIVSVNGKNDDYATNNFGSSLVDPVVLFPNDITMNLKTNSYANQQYAFVVRDHEWNIVNQRLSFADNKLYSDDLTLEDGCYDLELTNKLGYGLYIFFMVDQVGRGSFNIESRGKTIATYNPDFGNTIYQQFKVGPVPEADYSKDTVFFGSSKIGEEIQASLEISPKTNKAITVYNNSIFMGESFGFKVLSTVPELIAGNPVTIEPGEKMIVNLSFIPKKEGDTGANLVFNTDDFYVQDNTIRLVGKGIDPNGVDEHNKSNSSIDVSFNQNTKVANIKIETSSNIFNTNVKVYDSMGNLISIIYDNAAFNGYDEFTFNADRLSSGVYHFVMSNGESFISKSVAISK